VRWAIISDLHANLEAFEAVLANIDTIGVDKTICLGDVVGYNASPNECVELVRARNIDTICGNHDAVACGKEEPWGFNPVALAAALWTREALTEESHEWLRSLPDTREFDDFLAVHGSPDDRDCYMLTWEHVIPHVSLLQEKKYDLCFFGHTHSPGIFAADGMYTVDENSKFPLGQGKLFFINPGSVGQPRDGDPRAAFGILDTEKREFELVRVEYPVREAANRIIEKGLPQVLADRLFLGR
jgi:diadenosine tetraphosphatase ApaH/serine/threonine PP2A family protein phosphatase